ncbi:MAG: HAMP domain-containing protein, partial [Burkholderiales bacterium]|nr:HAMP domain-containing protein [Burkholderiales bacterium]
MTSRMRRFRIALASRGGKFLTAAVAALGAVLLYLLSTASSNTPMFEDSLSWLLLAGVGVVSLLVLVTGFQLLVLRRRLKQRVFGSKLTLRLTLLFTLVAVLPGALVYSVSVQFLAKSIDSWFDVRVERALEGGLALGRNALESMLRDLRGKADSMALTLSDRSPRQQLALLNSLREQAAVQEAALIDQSGRVVVFSGDERSGLLPELLSASVLRGIRMQKPYSGITAVPDRGLLLRVVVPVNIPDGQVLALELVQRVPDPISRNAEAVENAHSEYQELALSRVGLKRLYGLTLTLSLLMALFSALLLAIFFSQRLSAPLGVLAEGTRAVAQGDFSQRTPVRSYDELGILTQSFNAMTRDLADAQDVTQRYQAQLVDAKGSLESILATLSAGVISLDARRRLRSANPSASRILGFDLAQLADAPVELWAQREPRLAAIAEPLAAALDDLFEKDDWQVQVAYPAAGGELALLVRASPIVRAQPGGFVVVFDDITRLLQAQRQAAWGEVARRLAHEIKNPLTPIQLS